MEPQRQSDEVIPLQKGGRFSIPFRMRKALGMKEGDMLVVRVEGGRLIVSSVTQAVKEAQARVRRFVPARRKLSEELLKERRREAARE